MASVLLTRPRLRSSPDDELHRILSSGGVAIQELPMIRFEWPSDLAELDAAFLDAANGAFDAVILSSPTAVNFFEARARKLGILDSLRATAQFGAVGVATSSELSELGMRIRFPIPARAGASQLAAMLLKHDLFGKRVLLLQSQIGLETLYYALTEIGAEATRVTLYRTEGPTLSDAARLLMLLESENPPNVIAFFSPSAVRHFIRVLAEMASAMLRQLPAIATIGETTAKAIEEALHRRPEIVARKADQASLAEDILRYLQP